MIKELKEKYNYLKKSSSHVWANDNWSLYRFSVFLFSSRGQKRIWNFTGRATRYLFRTVLGIKKSEPDLYGLWMKHYFPDANKLNQYKKEIQGFSYTPKVSILISFHPGLPEPDQSTIQSIVSQVYQNWEICMVVPHNSINEAIDLCGAFPEYKDSIRVIELAGESSSDHLWDSAFKAAAGEFVTMVNFRDKLSPDALYQNIALLNNHPETDLVYSDEDKTDDTGSYYDPIFKPDWCPDNFLTGNYLGNMVLIRRAMAVKAGGFSNRENTNTPYDLLLRVTELTGNIRHIPLVLYHKSVAAENIAGTTTVQPADVSSNLSALKSALIRRGIPGAVSMVEGLPGCYSIRYKVSVQKKVTIIIPTKNRTPLCEVVISSIIKLTDYTNYEILLVDNNSDETDFFEMVDKYKKQEPVRFRYIRDTGSFNFSRLMNLAAAQATGKYLLLLNNDTEVLHSDWMTALVEQCQFKDNGIAGARLLYYNNTIQHAGVIIGLGGIAGHAFTGFGKDAPGYMNNLKCIRNYSALTAACFMVRKEVFDEVGGFDEQLAVDFNDVDFCLKVKERGYNNLYLPHVTLYHYESISRGHPHKTRKSYQQHLNDLSVFKSRWQKYIDHDPCYSPHLTKIFTDFRITQTY